MRRRRGRRGCTTLDNHQIWASLALPGAVHDLTTARTHGLIDALTSVNIVAFADKTYQDAGGSVPTPFNVADTDPAVPTAEELQPPPRATIRAVAERAVAAPQGLESSGQAPLLPRRATAIIQAILVLHHIQIT